MSTARVSITTRLLPALGLLVPLLLPPILPSPAHADPPATDPPATDANDPPATADPPFAFGPVPGHSIFAGIHGGLSLGGTEHPIIDPGGYLGAEISVNRLLEGTWIGGFADANYDFARQELLLAIGPQLGHLALGLDAGPALRLRDDAFDLGAHARVLVTTALIALYARYAYFSDGDPHLFQIGLMFKLPLWASDAGDHP